MELSTPVLFLIFNRPGNTRLVFDTIRTARPKRLFVAADGPRANHPKDVELCDAARDVISLVDWDCEVLTLFRSANLGCKRAVSGAIDWFFERVEEGIILEDDCRPDATFFRFCQELLSRYRDDDQVMSVSGSNLLGRPYKAATQSYLFGHGGIWGWATWRRAWQHYDIEMNAWGQDQTKQKIREAIGTTDWYNTYYGLFESSYNGSLDTWDIQWFYSILIRDGRAINPVTNMVHNIGFSDGTHINSANHPVTKLRVSAMPFPLKHPKAKKTDLVYLKILFKSMNRRPTIFHRILKKISGAIKSSDSAE